MGHRRFPCLLGKNGSTYRKREGDGKSPKGRWKLEDLHIRHRRFPARLRAKPLKPDDGWCDAVGDPHYNRKVKLPFHPSHEKLWRSDTAYDLLVTTNHNQRPRVQGGGSAIFFHLIRDGAQFTEGCVALKERDMKHVLSAVGKRAYIVI